MFLCLAVGLALTLIVSRAALYAQTVPLSQGGAGAGPVVGNILTARASATLSKTDNTLTDVAGMSVTLEAATTYTFRVELFCTATDGGLRSLINGTATASAYVAEGVTIYDGATANSRTTTFGNGVSTVATVVAPTVHITITGMITTTDAGTFKVQFSQVSTNAAASTALVNSYMWVMETE
ncbi:hypothetical protein [Longimicrobium sp.]|uniref:hypothetical protein n=1 Tax=Longimicrobium sp. TaxID=2029185 RepID=UPI002E325293|nr:hypothetical protein [Longimicrobium sp.]HEX6038903.1 hypothetical protein [Longimicrobium sp.]